SIWLPMTSGAHMTNRPPKTASDHQSSDPPAEAGRSEAAAAEAVDSKIEALEEAGDDMEDLRRRYMLKRFWQTARRFWTDRPLHVAWALSAALLLIILLNVGASYAMNLWHRSIFDALEKRDAGTVLTLSLLYFAILGVSVCFSVAQVYARMTLQRRWR